MGNTNSVTTNSQNKATKTDESGESENKQHVRIILEGLTNAGKSSTLQKIKSDNDSPGMTIWRPGFHVLQWNVCDFRFMCMENSYEGGRSAVSLSS